MSGFGWNCKMLKNAIVWMRVIDGMDTTKGLVRNTWTTHRKFWI